MSAWYSSHSSRRAVAMRILPGPEVERVTRIGVLPSPLSLVRSDEPDDLLDDDFEEKLTILVQVGNELSKSPTFDDLCRLAVEMGRAYLGFERLGLWFSGSARKRVT
jgi:hypothetical protein